MNNSSISGIFTGSKSLAPDQNPSVINRPLFGSQTVLELKSTLFSRMSPSKRKDGSNAALATESTRATRMNINDTSAQNLLAVGG